MSLTTNKKRKLLLIGWDSADWKIINKITDAGGLAGINHLLDQGSYGNLATLEPQLSPMLWTSVATGKMAYHHGVHGFTEVDPLTGAVVPVSAASRKAQTVWEILERNEKKCHLVSWFASQGEQMKNGKMVSNMFNHAGKASPSSDPKKWPPPPPGTYSPESLGDEMNQLRMAPFEIDAEILAPFIRNGRDINQRQDKRLFQLRKQLAEAYSAHSAAMHLMQIDPDWDFMAVYYRAIDEICHTFMKFHPPKMEGISEQDFEIYQNVVEATYRVHDMMLSNLLQQAGPDTTVILVSDHGFHSDHLRPAFTPRVPAGITVWHREQGVFLAKGPGIQAGGENVFGASLLDITPTILHFFGLPVGKDMEGRVLSEILTNDEPVQTIPTWENTASDAKDHSHSSLSKEASEDLLQQFVDLGYIDESSFEGDAAAKKTICENKWNLARACIFGNQLEQALALMEDCVAVQPDRQDYAQILAQTQLHLGLLDEAEQTLSRVVDSFGTHFGAKLLQARVAQFRNDSLKAEAYLSEIEEEASQHPQLLELSCEVYHSLKRHKRAKKAAESLLALDPDNYTANLTMGRCHLTIKEYRKSIDYALKAIQLQFGNYRAHYLLGLAYQGAGDLEGAQTAFSNCLKLSPDHPNASQNLAQLFRQKGLLDEAAILEGKALTLKIERENEKKERLQFLRAKTAERAEAHAKARAEEKRRAQPAGKTSGKQSQANESKDEAEPLTLTLVSGLPRSGTSLMMQMLAAAGLQAMTDGKRKADSNNPKGYYEWEKIKQLRKDPSILLEAKGKVAKVVTPLIPHLPNRYRYRIILMERPISEVVASQKTMLERQGKKLRAEEAHLTKSQGDHYQQIKKTLLDSPLVEVLVVNYPKLIAQPEIACQKLIDFLGDSLENPARLAGPIDPKLYRSKGEA